LFATLVPLVPMLSPSHQFRSPLFQMITGSDLHLFRSS
jgi:hypothetical protein